MQSSLSVPSHPRAIGGDGGCLMTESGLRGILMNWMFEPGYQWERAMDCPYAYGCYMPSDEDIAEFEERERREAEQAACDALFAWGEYLLDNE